MTEKKAAKTVTKQAKAKKATPKLNAAKVETRQSKTYKIHP